MNQDASKEDTKYRRWERSNRYGHVGNAVDMSVSSSNDRRRRKRALSRPAQSCNLHECGERNWTLRVLS